MTTGTTLVPETYLTVEQIAERLQTTETTVRDWLKSGRLVGFKPGGRRVGWRVRESDLERFVEQAITARTDSEATALRHLTDLAKSLAATDQQAGDYRPNYAETRWDEHIDEIHRILPPGFNNRRAAAIWRDAYWSREENVPSVHVPREQTGPPR